MIRGEIKRSWDDKFRHEDTPRRFDSALLPEKSPSKQNGTKKPSLKSRALRPHALSRPDAPATAKRHSSTLAAHAINNTRTLATLFNQILEQ